MKIEIHGLSSVEAAHLSMLAMENDVEIENKDNVPSNFGARSNALGLAEVALAGVLTIPTAAVLMVYINKTFEQKSKESILQIDESVIKGDKTLSLTFKSSENSTSSIGNSQEQLLAILDKYNIPMGEVIKLAKEIESNAE